MLSVPHSSELGFTDPGKDSLQVQEMHRGLLLLSYTQCRLTE